MTALPLAVRIHQYLRTLAPHMREREAATLLAEAEDELDRISEQQFVEQGLAAIMGGWIPVSEQLPGRRDRVLVAYRQSEWCNSTHRYYSLERLGVEPATYLLMGEKGLQFCASDGGIVTDATHWQPLPEPPTP